MNPAPTIPPPFACTTAASLNQLWLLERAVDRRTDLRFKSQPSHCAGWLWVSLLPSLSLRLLFSEMEAQSRSATICCCHQVPGKGFSGRLPCSNQNYPCLGRKLSQGTKGASLNWAPIMAMLSDTEVYANWPGLWCWAFHTSSVREVPFLIDEESGAQRWKDLLKISQLVNDGARIQSQMWINL